MKRIFLFVVTNLAVLALLGLMVFIIESVFGVRLGQGGAGGLLVSAAIFGFGGALISLALSKWTAKRMLGVRVIGGFMRLFMSHPPLDARIAALRSPHA
jgi:heat shock protein HtpX